MQRVYCENIVQDIKLACLANTKAAKKVYVQIGMAEGGYL